MSAQHSWCSEVKMGSRCWQRHLFSLGCLLPTGMSALPKWAEPRDYHTGVQSTVTCRAWGEAQQGDSGAHTWW